jgi:hypothetical protein
MSSCEVAKNLNGLFTKVLNTLLACLKRANRFHLHEATILELKLPCPNSTGEKLKHKL